MSVSVYWTTDPKRYDIPGDYMGSGLVKALESTFGSRILDESDLQLLKAMSRANGKKDNPFKILVTAIEKHGKIHWGTEH